jgi:hypothetical protein
LTDVISRHHVVWRCGRGSQADGVD